jgi:membrane associated rhomboid family serine protease
MVIGAALIAGVYGALYDQLTYSICPEFFTKYRFIQSQFKFESDLSPRLGVAFIGFLNTWKAGVIIGSILSLAGLITKNPKHMLHITSRAFYITLIIAFIAGIIGWSIGSLPGQADPDPSLAIMDKEHFKTVENMLNFSYAGAVIGMFIGIFYLVYKHKKLRQQETGIN